MGADLFRGVEEEIDITRQYGKFFRGCETIRFLISSHANFYGGVVWILERKVKDAWWRKAVDMRDDIVAFDSSMVIHQSTLIASGHVASFGPTSSLGSRRCPDCSMKETLHRGRSHRSNREVVPHRNNAPVI